MFSGPNLYESIVDGRVASIWVGHTIYRAIPASCKTNAKFVETHPQGFATVESVDRVRGHSVGTRGEDLTAGIVCR